METPLTPPKWYKKWWGILTIIIITLFLASGIAFGIMIMDYAQKIKSGEISKSFNVEQSHKVMQLRQLLETNDDPFIGTVDPKVTIVKFVDMNCPKCRQSYPIMQELAALYSDDVKFIIKNFPVIEESSFSLAIAGACAHEQKKFFPFYDKIMRTEEVISKEALNKFALQSGLHLQQFTSCLNNQKHVSEIKLDVKEGVTAGVKGTPAWFINGQKIEGIVPLETFKKIIDLIIAKK